MAFISNTFGFTKKLLGEKRSGHKQSSTEEIDAFLKETLKDPNRLRDLEVNTSLITPTPSSMNFDLKEPTWIEIQAVMKKARSGSAPGPNGVPYIVYKRCPQILRFLLKLLRIIWRRGKVVGQWRYSQGIWILKEEGAKKINQFRCISLLNVEGKIFFSLLNRRLVDFLLKNTYIVQKGGVPGMPGVIELTGVITQLLKEAKANKGDMAVLWLDLKNAYGYIPHSLVQETPKQNHRNHWGLLSQLPDENGFREYNIGMALF